LKEHLFGLKDFMELEPEQPQPIYLHFKQQKFFEIQINRKKLFSFLATLSS